jgi:hypothetical protein
MASNINPATIDITYPIAGQDNDTQGFRSNFRDIQTNFITAAAEITALQGNVSTVQNGSFTGNITLAGNVITNTIISPAGTNSNITIDPNGNGAVVFPINTELYVQSGAISANINSGAIIVKGGVGISGNINLGGNLFTGTPINYVDTGILSTIASNTAGYNQIILQNQSSATNASTNFNVSNNLGNAITNYGEFGINSSTFTGSGAFSTSGTVYLASATTDLAIGTYGANSIHFVINSSATDAMTITSNSIVTLASAIQFANLTTTQVSAISTPQRGMTIYNYTTGNIQVYNGTKWANVTLS